LVRCRWIDAGAVGFLFGTLAGCHSGEHTFDVPEEDLSTLKAKAEEAVKNASGPLKSDSTDGGRVRMLSACGEAFLRAYSATDKLEHLSTAADVSLMLDAAQTDPGGWGTSVDVDAVPGDCTFDNNTSQGALRFLINLQEDLDEAWDKPSVVDRAWIATTRPGVALAVERGIEFFAEGQAETGGWPQSYSERQNHKTYHDYHIINDCIAIMMYTYNHLGGEEYLKIVNRAGDFIVESRIQMGDEQNKRVAWAQRYNLDMEPDSKNVCSSVTSRNMRTLADMYLVTGDTRYLDTARHARAWLERSELTQPPEDCPTNGTCPEEPMNQWALLYTSHDDRIPGDTGAYGIRDDIKYFESVRDRATTGRQEVVPTLEERSRQKLTREEHLEQLGSRARAARTAIAALERIAEERQWVDDADRQLEFVRYLNDLVDYLETCEALDPSAC
jgi:uncharacterized protein YyaL (SSP411 family)